jgi:hypothetical protein
VVGRFLRQRFGTGAIDPHAITVEDVTRYVSAQIPAGSPASAQLSKGDKGQSRVREGALC